MKRVIVIIIIVIPLLFTKAQEIAQNFNFSAEQFTAQFDQIKSKELSKEQEEKILKSFSPETRTKLEEIKKLNKDKYVQLLQSFGGAMLWSSEFGKAEAVFGLKGISEAYKKENELKIEVEHLVLKYKQPGEKEKQKLKNELSIKLGELFEINESKKQDEISKLEKRLQELRESLQARKDNKQEIVTRRIQELLGDVKYLRWD